MSGWLSPSRLENLLITKVMEELLDTPAVIVLNTLEQRAKAGHATIRIPIGMAGQLRCGCTGGTNVAGFALGKGQPVQKRGLIASGL